MTRRRLSSFVIIALVLLCLAVPAGFAQSPPSPPAKEDRPEPTPEQKALYQEMQAKRQALMKECREKMQALRAEYDPKFKALGMPVPGEGGPGMRGGMPGGPRPEGTKPAPR